MGLPYHNLARAAAFNPSVSDLTLMPGINCLKATFSAYSTTPFPSRWGALARIWSLPSSKHRTKIPS